VVDRTAWIFLDIDSAVVCKSDQPAEPKSRSAGGLEAPSAKIINPSFLVIEVGSIPTRTL
jgi:hypothetical protein